MGRDNHKHNKNENERPVTGATLTTRLDVVRGEGAKMRQFGAVASIFAVVVSGCAIHPLPEDITRETTYEIIQKIRCEGREALDNISVQILRRSTDPRILELADRVASGELTVIEMFRRYGPLLNSRLDKRDLLLFRFYTLSAVTFDFNFTIREENNNQVNANFRLPVSNGLFTLGTRAGANLTRKSERKIQITNSFFELHELSPAFCAARSVAVGNIVYPITGKIGVEEVFKTFVNIDRDAGTNTFSDALTFTTLLDASATPTIALDPVPARQFRLAEASGTFGVVRSDQHGVTIALARGPLARSLEEARGIAKKKSKAIADQKRMEDLIIIPRERVIIVE